MRRRGTRLRSCPATESLAATSPFSLDFPSAHPRDLIMSFTNMHLFFDDVEVGQEWESCARTITEGDIIHYAGLSGDFNPIHVDHEFAKTTPFRRPIAHGLLVLGIGSGLGTMAPPMRTLAFLALREWHFRAAVFIGDTIRIRTK